MNWATHLSNRELREAGFVRALDGVLLDNRDAFHDRHPNHMRTYDSRRRATYDPRTHAVISHDLLNRLLLALIREVERDEQTRAAA